MGKYTDDKCLETLYEMGADVPGALNRFIDNAELYKKFLRKFPEDGSFPGLMANLSEDKVKDAFYFAHTLKGVAANLGFVNLTDVLHPVVEDLRVGKPADPAQIEQCCEVYQKIVDVINQYA